MRRALPFSSAVSSAICSVLLLTSLVACGGKDGDDTAGGGGGGDGGGDTDTDVPCDTSLDRDCDGVNDEDDCDPDDARTYPGAPEIPYDDRDNDCAGDGDLTDVDGDGFDGPVGVGPDCNDNNPTINPDADETCYDGIDQNCDGSPAEGEGESPDCDGDGYDGYGTSADDCDDTDPSINPGAEEVWYDGLDGNCDGHIYSDYDADYDGDESADYDGTDCDDHDPATYGSEEDGSLRSERLDGVDRNCDGDVDRVTVFDADMAWFGNSMSNDGLFGKAAVATDDYDGDGTIDIVVGGAWSDEDDELCIQDGSVGSAVYCGGWVRVLLLDGNDGTPGDVAHATFAGATGDGESNYGAWAGYDLANMGDLDGDGWSEVAVGKPLASEIEVFPGDLFQAGGEIFSYNAIATATGGTFMGFDVASLGDVDGDGLAELVGSVSDGWIGGANGNLDLKIWTGAAVAAGGNLVGSSALFTIDASSAGGEAVGGPDFDGDGVAELIVGSNTLTSSGALSTGKVFLVSGDDIGVGGSFTADDFTGLTGGSNGGVGIQNAFMDDIDGDGVPELVVSAPGVASSYDGSGEVYIVSAADAFVGGRAADVASFTVQGTDIEGRLTAVSEEMGDINADGLDDLVVSNLGGTALSSITGTVQIFYGDTVLAGGTVLDTDGESSLPTRTADDQFGFAGLIFDYDGDGDDDLALGGPFSSDVGMFALYQSYFIQ
jgi:hypothetical protein